jgi:chemotaxis protein methyltransferase CheR
MERVERDSVNEAGFVYTEQDFQFLSRFAYEHCGISISESKRQMIYNRLIRRLRELGISRFADYKKLLLDDSADELGQFLNAITTNVTSFFREGHHFQHLADSTLPRLMRARAQQKKLRIWSAGCSTGEEPYTLAITLRENQPDTSWDTRILATDLDSNVLAKGRSGIYPADRVKTIENKMLRRWFQRGSGPNQGKVRVSSALREMVHFQQLNLLQAWPMKGPFDIIFCRNVLIYFDKPTQKTILERYYDLLADDGELFVGHSESLLKVTDRFRLLGKTVYRKQL